MRARLQFAYFTYFLYLGTFGPLWTNYVTRGLGMSSRVAGVLAILLVTGLLGIGVAVARLSDRKRCRRTVQRTLSAAAILTTASWLLVRDPVVAGALMIVHGGVAHVHGLLLDASAIDALGANRNRYGRTRLFGTLGYGVGALVIGQLRHGHPEVIMGGAAAFMALFHLATWLLPDAQAGAATHGLPPFSAAALRARPVLLLLGAQFLVGVASAPYEIFGSCYFEEIGLSSASYGRLIALGIASEIIVFALTPRWLIQVPAERLALASLVIAALRWTVMPSLHGEVPLLLLQCCHGLCFGLWHGSALHILSHFVPPEARTTGQAAYGITISLGFGVGGFLTGEIREALAPQALFSGASVLLLVACGLVLAVRTLARKAAARPPEPRLAEP